MVTISLLVAADDVEVTNFNWPKDKVFDWMLGPLLVLKEQMKKLELTEDEELCLQKLIMTNANEKPSDWDDCGFPSSDGVKRAQLQAIIRRCLFLYTLPTLPQSTPKYKFETATESVTYSSINRLQGIVANMSRIPSFRRRFMSLARALYLEAIDAGTIDGSRKVERKVKADIASEELQSRDVGDTKGSSNGTSVDVDMV